MFKYLAQSLAFVPGARWALPRFPLDPVCGVHSSELKRGGCPVWKNLDFISAVGRKCSLHLFYYLLLALEWITTECEVARIRVSCLSFKKKRFTQVPCAH